MRTERAAARPASSPFTRHPIGATLAAAGFAGLCFGLLYPARQVAIEPAQLLAGLVEYPPDNPFGLYQHRLWTAWHQLLALLLEAGVDERTLIFWVSGSLGVLAFAALAAFALACGATPGFALSAPFFVWFLNPIGWGFNYPILLIGHPHTYGMAGLAWIVLAVGLLGAGRWATGSFLLGVAPAVHPSLGAWAALITGLCALPSWREIRPQLARIVLAGAAGAALAGVSLAVHLAGQPPGPAVDPADEARHLGAFLALWDAHRRAVDVDWRMLVLGIGSAVAVARLVRDRRQLGPGTALALRIYVACGLLGIAASALRAGVPTEAIPRWLLAAMPTRVANFSMLCLVPLLVGTLIAERAKPLSRWPLLGLAAVSLLWFRAWWLLDWGIPLLGGATLVLVLWPRRGEDGALARFTTRHLRALDSGIGVAVAIGIALVLADSVDSLPKRLARLRDRTNDPVLAAAAAGSGLLAAAPGLPNVQLVTRRPLVLDPNALDMLPYAPSGGPELARLLRLVYGVDFFVPPPDARHQPAVPVDSLKRTWEARDAAAWRAVGARTGVTEVLVPGSWQLHLPEVARDPYAALYRVPPPDGSEAR